MNSFLSGQIQRVRTSLRDPVLRAQSLAVLLLVLLIPIWGRAGAWYENQLMTDARADAMIRTSLSAHSLSIAVNRRFSRLEGLYAFVQAVAGDGDLAAKFEPFAAGLQVGVSGIQTLTVAPGGIVEYVYPLEGNEAMIGADLAADPRAEVRAAVNRALVTGRVVLTKLDNLGQGPGIVARQAVYLDGKYWGMVSLAFNLEPVLAEAGIAQEAEGLTFSVRDEGGGVLFGPESVFSQNPVTSSVPLPEGSWDVAAAPAQGWYGAIQYPLVVAEATGLVIILLVVSLAYANLGRQARLKLAVDAQTEQIRRINDELRFDIEKRKQVEHDLRESERLYRTLARNFPNGAVILYDRDLRYTIADGAGLAEVGLSSEMLEGKLLNELFPPEVVQVLEPAYRSALAGEARKVETSFADRCYEVRVHPLRDESGSVFAGMAMTQDITARKDAEEALLASESRLRALVDAIPDIMLRVDREGNYLDYHAEDTRDLLLPPEALIGANMRDTPMSPELVTQGLQVIAAALETKAIQTLEYTLDMPDGLHHYEARHVASGEEEVVITVRDITERKRAEGELARWAHIFEHAEWGVIVGSPDGVSVQTMNPAYARMHGYSVEELSAKPTRTVFAPGAEGELEELIQIANEQGHAVMESTHIRKDGTTFPVLVDLTAVRNENGQLLYRVANVQDITERKRAEEALRESKQRYEQLVNTVDSIVWEADAGTFEFFFVSKQAERLLGYPAERWVSEPTFWVDHIHPDDRDWAVNFCVLATAEMRPHEFEYRMVAADGRTVWLRDIVTVVVEEGKPSLLRGVMVDITERKTAEEQLKEKEEQYRGVFEASMDGLFINDLDGRLMEFNPAAARMHGYSLEEFQGIQPPQFIHPDSLPLFDEFTQTVKDGGVFRSRAVDVRKDGSLLPVEVLGTSFSYRGQPHTLAVVRDITEQVQAYELLEQRVQERTRELATLLEITRKVASTLELDPLMGLVLDQLKVVVPYTAAYIDTIQGDMMNVRAFRGPTPSADPLNAQMPIDDPIPSELTENRRPLLIPDVRGDDPWAIAFRKSLDDKFDVRVARTRCWMGVPLIVRDQVIGILALNHDQEGFYTPEHANLALAFANQVAAALENARLYQEAQKLAVVEERNRLSRDLHDSVTQQLYSLTLFAEAARRMLAAGDSSPVEAHLSKLGETAQQSLKEMRLLVYQLRAPALAEQGLIGALQQRLDAVEKRAGVDAVLKLEGEGAIPAQAEEELYWIAQESLNNILKHAAASSVTLTVRVGEDGLMMEIADNGSGFDAEAVLQGGMGLKGIRERVKRLDGGLELASAPGEGTRLIVTLAAA